MVVASVEKILEQMRREPANVRFADLMKVCETFFGKPRQHGTSHAIFKTPWPGEHPERQGPGQTVSGPAGVAGDSED